MKTRLAALLALAVFSSCGHYQYLTVSGDNISTSSKNNEFVSESDSVRISYNFNGEHGPVTITIANKSDKPLQVDWKKSALIVGDKPESYYRPEWQINGDVSGYRWTNYSSGTVAATVSGQEGMEFLPPHTTTTRTAMKVKPNGYFGLPEGVVEEKIKIDGFSKKLIKGTYTKENSPLVFRSYVTFLTGPEGQGFTTDHSFYVSQVVETVVVPELIWSQEEKPGNAFYIQGVVR